MPEQLIRDSLRDLVQRQIQLRLRPVFSARLRRAGMPTTRKCRFIDPAHEVEIITCRQDEPYGGSIAFTDDIVLSSTTVKSNDRFSLLDPEVQCPSQRLA